MWPFRRSKIEKSKKRKTVERVIAGVIVGAAISSIVGKKMLDKHREEGQE